MLEQFFKSQVAVISDPYQCNRITDALATAGIKFYCKTKDVNRRTTFDQARMGTLGIKPQYVTEVSAHSNRIQKPYEEHSIKKENLSQIFADRIFSICGVLSSLSNSVS